MGGWRDTEGTERTGIEDGGSGWRGRGGETPSDTGYYVCTFRSVVATFTWSLSFGFSRRLVEQGNIF